MRKHILIILVPVILAASSHVGNGQTVPAPGNGPAEYSNNALAFLAEATSDRHITQGTLPSAVITTNAATNGFPWEGNLSLGVTVTSGNSDSALVTGNVRAHKKMPHNEWTLGADAAYGEVSSVKNNETLHGYVQYNHLFNQRWYGYGRADALHDGIADVTYRFTFSPGAGYYFIKKKQTSLAGEFGPAILYEKLDGEYHTYPVVRFAERFEHKFNAHVRVWQNLEFLPPADSPRNFLINAQIGVETPLSKQLKLQVYVDDNYANHPALGRKDNDVKLVSALAIKF